MQVSVLSMGTKQIEFSCEEEKTTIGSVKRGKGQAKESTCSEQCDYTTQQWPQRRPTAESEGKIDIWYRTSVVTVVVRSMGVRGRPLGGPWGYRTEGLAWKLTQWRTVGTVGWWYIDRSREGYCSYLQQQYGDQLMGEGRGGWIWLSFSSGGAPLNGWWSPVGRIWPDELGRKRGEEGGIEWGEGKWQS